MNRVFVFCAGLGLGFFYGMFIACLLAVAKRGDEQLGIRE
jgi:hypothetical protein